jgi:hypothetical protein
MTANPTLEIERLCAEIKRLVPPKKPKDPTDQFEFFINNLKKNKVDPEDIDSIHRAYNYFNCLIATQPPKSEEQAKSTTSTTTSTTTTTTTSPTPLESKPTADQEKEMIGILLGLSEHLKPNP